MKGLAWTTVFSVLLQVVYTVAFFQGNTERLGPEGGGYHGEGMNFGAHGGAGSKMFGSFGKLPQRFKPVLASVNMLGKNGQQHGVLFVQSQTPMTFYAECGKLTRQCLWVPKPKDVMDHVETDAESADNVENNLQRACLTTNHICVGNTETCISDESCDVAMKITETTWDDLQSSNLQISYINNCKLDGQSTTDISRMPQVYFGIGFATYNEAGDALECRKPKPSDFKLIFLWKNSSVEETENPKICKPANKTDHFAVSTYDPQIVSSVAKWSKVCKSLDLATEGVFSLKSFMKGYVPSAYYTSFFSPPFDFADNFEPQYSSNKMAITGTIAE